MEFHPSLEVGAKVTQTTLVEDHHTAPHVGSGKAKVLATPVLVTLFEIAALALIEPCLPSGTQSLGIRLEIKHTAATPTKMEVDVTATLIGIKGRALTFEITARDELEQIACGTHERVVVDISKFDLNVQAKSNHQV
ncbi:MAG: fluoroacetyl-CoA thioesterase [Gammaproteobacteria bacterium]|jgi:fluoroacetyl-CoA thioesterase